MRFNRHGVRWVWYARRYGGWYHKSVNWPSVHVTRPYPGLLACELRWPTAYSLTECDSLREAVSTLCHGSRWLAVIAKALA